MNPLKPHQDTAERMNRNIVTLEEVLNRHKEMQSYLNDVTFEKAVYQCFFEKGWTVKYDKYIRYDFLNDIFTLYP